MNTGVTYRGAALSTGGGGGGIMLVVTASGTTPSSRRQLGQSFEVRWGLSAAVGAELASLSGGRPRPALAPGDFVAHPRAVPSKRRRNEDKAPRDPRPSPRPWTFAPAAHGRWDKQVLSALSRIAGPFAFVFFSPSRSTLYYGRDRIGRRSLVVRTPRYQPPFKVDGPRSAGRASDENETTS